MIAKLAKFRLLGRGHNPQHGRQVDPTSVPGNDNHRGRGPATAKRLQPRRILFCRWRKAPSGALECRWQLGPVAEAASDGPGISRRTELRWAAYRFRDNAVCTFIDFVILVGRIVERAAARLGPPSHAAGNLA